MLDHTEKRIDRARSLLVYGSFQEACQALVDDGATPSEAFCATVAAKIMNEAPSE